jgi:hypothetical protein
LKYLRSSSQHTTNIIHKPLTISNNKLLMCIHKDKITITKLYTLYSFSFFFKSNFKT